MTLTPSELQLREAHLPKRLAVCQLLGCCDVICNSGLLGDDLTAALRSNVAKVEQAFDIFGGKEAA